VLKLPQSKVSQTPVVVGIDKIGFKTDNPAVVNLGALKPAYIAVGITTVVVRSGQIRIKVNSLVIIFNGIFILAGSDDCLTLR
jgi:hypothetical protein